jgi:DNA replication protein DnaC
MMDIIEKPVKDMSAKLAAAKAASVTRPKLIPMRYLCDPDCPDCHGSGFVSVRSVEPSPWRAGEVEVERTRTCDRQMLLIQTAASRLAPDELAMRWADVEDMDDAKAAEKLIRAVMQDGFGWVYLHGDPGIAKTVLLKVAVAESIRQGVQAAYTNMSAILDDLRAAYDTNAPNEQSIARLERWTRIPLLAIDEFDRFKATEFAKEKLYRLMDARYVYALRGGSMTLMASNLPPEGLAVDGDQYLVDRIRDGRFRVRHMRGASARPAMTWDANGVAQREEGE